MDHRTSIIQYLNSFSNLLKIDDNNISALIEIKKKISIIKKNKNKIFIIGNGGSSAIASHFSVDLTLNYHVKCYNLNEADLITCFANDFGYENWVSKALELYGTRGDGLIAISSSGKSKNIINACITAKKMRFLYVSTFTGFNKSNTVRKLGSQNIWIDSKNYNFVENAHQILLLMLVDLLKKN